MAGRPKVHFKAGDIWDVPDDDLRYEVIDGELFLTPAPIPEHQHAIVELLVPIHQWVRSRGSGEILPAPIGVVLDEETAVQPDLVYIASEHLGIIGERGIEGPPDLVVEVLSPSTEARDRGVKMRRYAAAGIPHYWLLNLRARALEAYSLGENGYDLVGVYGPGGIFQPALFPGLEISIDSLWAH